MKHNLKQPLFIVIFIFRYLSVISVVVVVSPAGRRCRRLPPDVVVVSPAGRRGRVSRRTSWSSSPAGRRGRRFPPDVVVVVSRRTSCLLPDVVSPAGRRGRRLPLDVVSPAGRHGRRLPLDVVVVCFSLRHVSKTVYKFAFFVVPLLV